MADPLFDTHAHLIAADPVAYPPSAMRGKGKPDEIKETFPAERLIAEMDKNGVGKACVVQRAHIYGYDNSYIIDAAKLYPDRLISVVVLDAQDPGTPDVLTRMAKSDGVRGVRFAASRPDEYDTGWLNSPAAMACWKTAADLALPVAIIFYRGHLSWGLPALQMIAERHPDLPIVIDHIGTPHASNGEIRWATAQGISYAIPGAPDYGIDSALAAFEPLRNVSFKFTDINVDRLKDGTIEPAKFIRRLADQFGATRLIWGSDVGQSEGPYGEKTEVARAAADELDASERAQFLFGAAAKIYG